MGKIEKPLKRITEIYHEIKTLDNKDAYTPELNTKSYWESAIIRYLEELINHLNQEELECACPCH